MKELPRQGCTKRLRPPRALSELVERQPDLDKALEYELLALEQGTNWFRRRVEQRDSRDGRLTLLPGHRHETRLRISLR